MRGWSGNLIYELLDSNAGTREKRQTKVRASSYVGGEVYDSYAYGHITEGNHNGKEAKHSVSPLSSSSSASVSSYSGGYGGGDSSAYAENGVYADVSDISSSGESLRAHRDISPTHIPERTSEVRVVASSSSIPPSALEGDVESSKNHHSAMDSFVLSSSTPSASHLMSFFSGVTVNALRRHSTRDMEDAMLEEALRIFTHDDLRCLVRLVGTRVVVGSSSSAL